MVQEEQRKLANANTAHVKSVLEGQQTEFKNLIKVVGYLAASNDSLSRNQSLLAEHLKRLSLVAATSINFLTLQVAALSSPSDDSKTVKLATLDVKGLDGFTAAPCPRLIVGDEEGEPQMKIDLAHINARTPPKNVFIEACKSADQLLGLEWTEHTIEKKALAERILWLCIGAPIHNDRESFRIEIKANGIGSHDDESKRRASTLEHIALASAALGSNVSQSIQSLLCWLALRQSFQ